MKKLLSTLAKTVLGAAIVAGMSATAFAADPYPSKPVTFVVPFAAGGPTDRVARELAEAMKKSLGGSIIVDNAAGAGGTIGTSKVAKAEADGHTILLMHIGFSTAPALYRKLNYDPIKDFEPIGLIVDVPATLVARDNFPAKNMKEFLDYARANKEKLSFANAGIGSASHLCGLLFMSTIKTDFQTVPYKGTNPAMTDLMGKQVDFMCDQTTNTTSQIKSGRIKAYGVTTRNRIPSMPDLPTMNEGGVSGFEFGVWHGLWAPKGTPKPVLDKLVAALQAGLADQKFRGHMTELGAIVMPADRATPKALGDHVQAQINKWGPIIKAASVYAD